MRAESPAPLPLILAALTFPEVVSVPWKVGETLRTTLPLPVLLVTPVPPLATASVP